MSPEPASKGYEESIEEGGGEPHRFKVSTKPKSIMKPRKRLCLEEEESEDWNENGSSQVEEHRPRIRIPNGRIDPKLILPIQDHINLSHHEVITMNRSWRHL